MRAIRVSEFGPPEVMKLEAVSDPQPGPGQVLVRVRAAGVNPVETYIRSGTYARKPPLPYTPGADAAGDVAAVGEGVTGVSAGDRVYTSGSVTGAYAEMTLCEASTVHPLPQNVSYNQGASLGVPYATAYRALHQKARGKPGETVLIHGASGGVGVAATQMAVAQGMTVIGTASTDRGIGLIRAMGAAHALNHSQEGYLERVMEITGGRGVDVILEMLANVNLGKDLTVLSPGGRVVVIGNRGTVEINPRDAMARDASILGMVLFNASHAEMRSIHAALGAGLANGSLRPEIGRELPLADAPKAHEAVMAPGAHGKIVLVP